MTARHLISQIFSVALFPLLVFRVTSPRMCLPSQISVRLPSVIHFIWLPFIFGIFFLTPFSPRPPSGSSRVVFPGTYLTSKLTLLDAPWVSLRFRAGLSRPGPITRLVVFYYCHGASIIIYSTFIVLFCDLLNFHKCIIFIIIFTIILFFVFFVYFIFYNRFLLL